MDLQAFSGDCYELLRALVHVNASFAHSYDNRIICRTNRELRTHIGYRTHRCLNDESLVAVHEITGVSVDPAVYQPELVFRMDDQRRLFIDAQRLCITQQQAHPLSGSGGQTFAGINQVTDFRQHSTTVLANNSRDRAHGNIGGDPRRRLHNDRYSHDNSSGDGQGHRPTPKCWPGLALLPVAMDLGIHASTLWQLGAGAPLALHAIVDSRFNIFGYGRARTCQAQQSRHCLVIAIEVFALSRLVVHLTFLHIVQLCSLESSLNPQ